MVIINPVPVPPYGGVAYTNITPFTYRDGATYLSVLESLRAYIRDILVPHVDGSFDQLEKYVDTAVSQLTDYVEEIAENIGDLIDEAEQAKLVALAAQAAAEAARDLASTYASDAADIQDGAITGIFEDTGSSSREFLDGEYTTKTETGELADTVDSQGTSIGELVDIVTEDIPAQFNTQDTRITDVETVIGGRLSQSSMDTRYVRASTLFVNAKDFGALGNDSAHDEIAIQEAIDYAGENGLTVKIPEGVYRLYETLYLRHDGITVIADKGAVFKRYHGSSIWLNGDFGTTTPNNDVHVSGGVYDMRGQVNNTHGCAFSFGKAVRFSIKNLDILNTWKSHGIEIEGSSYGHIDGVRFGGLVDVEDTHYYAEMIQVGQITTVGFPRFNIDDKTPTTNVTIENCSQLAPQVGAKIWPCAVGNHSAPVVGGVAPNRIFIDNNDFGSCSYVAIRPWGWRNVRISYNRASAPVAIQWDGMSPGADVGMEIFGNILSGTTRGIECNRTRGGRITGNTVTGDAVGIFVGEGSSNTVIAENYVNTQSDNIQVQNNAAGNDNSKVIIRDNTLVNGRYNIQIYNNANGGASRCIISGNTGTASDTAFLNLLSDGCVVTGNLVYSTSGETAILAPSGADFNIITGNAVPAGKTITNANTSNNTVANNRAFQ